MVKGRRRGMNLNKNRIGKYELGRTLGEGSFGEVKSAFNVETGQSYAMKILNKDKVFHCKIVEHFKREIYTLKFIKHPNVVRLYEVLATKKKIYIVLEFVNGGDLFDQVSCNGKLKESEARKYFQQLINAVGYCHSRGVYHRDLKAENLLLDTNGNLKICDFGLSAVPRQLREDGLLHTTCGSPNYVAPEVIANGGYDGATADVWSCGVILFLLLTGWLPFDDNNLAVLYYRIFKADFRFPKWLSAGARNLIKLILDPNVKTRITIPEILEDEWFKQGYSLTKFEEDTSLADIDAACTNSEEHMLTEETGPVQMNAFQLISMSRSLDLSGLFEEEDAAERKTRFTSMYPAKDIMHKMEETGRAMGFQVQRKNSKLNLLHVHPKSKGTGQLSIAAEMFEVNPCLHVIELRKSAGDIARYRELCRTLSGILSLQENDNVQRSKDGIGCP